MVVYLSVINNTVLAGKLARLLHLVHVRDVFQCELIEELRVRLLILGLERLVQLFVILNLSGRSRHHILFSALESHVEEVTVSLTDVVCASVLENILLDAASDVCVWLSFNLALARCNAGIVAALFGLTLSASLRRFF